MTMTASTPPFLYSLYQHSLQQASPFCPTYSPSSEWDTGIVSLVNNLLNGETMPGFQALARHIFHSATGQPLAQVPTLSSAGGFIGETAACRLYLLYRPNRSWLRSNDAVLNHQQVALIEQANNDNKRCIVFAAAKFMNSQVLTKKQIEFYPLPYALQQLPTVCTHSQIHCPPTTPLTQFQHREDNGWRELDYERDILGHLDWHILHFSKTNRFVAQIQRQGMPDEHAQPIANPAALSSAFHVWHLLDVIPNPWQAIRILEEALALLNDQGLSDTELLRACPALIQAIRSDVQQQVAMQADTLFRRKLAIADIRQRNLQ